MWGGEGAEGAEGAEVTRGPASLAFRLDPARDLQRLHALLVAHVHRLDERLHRPPGTRQYLHLAFLKLNFN